MNNEPFLKTLSRSHWNIIGAKHHHGVCIPLFALHSSESSGIGEYPDLLKMIEWCKDIGMDTIQLLPLNDTGEEISPYSPVSVMALNPIYLGLSCLPNVKETKLLKNLKKLNKTQLIDYEKVRAMKDSFLKDYFQEQFSYVNKSRSYKKFVSNNPWLKEYAEFKVSKGKNSDQKELDYHYFLQYLCNCQLKEVKKRADKNGVLLKGDIPILISSNSVDVKENPELFDLSISVGAPPDQYSPRGQNWNFPHYRLAEEWDQVLEWWKRRLQFQENFFHLYRVDHVVGLFRMWTIPKGKNATEGEYLPNNPRKWIPQGKKILEYFLKQTKMMPIAEDLGTVPKSVKMCLLKMGIPGTKVMRWEKNSGLNDSYIPLEKYPKASMTTVSTHDTETLNQWWKQHPEEAKSFAEFLGLKYKKTLSSEQQKTILHLSHHTGSYFHINLLQEYFPLVPGFTWDKPDDERINRPDRYSKKNWRYRYRKSLEEIVSNKKFKKIMKNLISYKALT